MHAKPSNSEDIGSRAAKPTRISVTVPYTIYRALVSKSSHEGRSLSNLASYLVAQALNPTSCKDQNQS